MVNKNKTKIKNAVQGRCSHLIFVLFKACAVGDEKAVLWYIENAPHEINTPDKNGRLPIFYAIRQNNITMLRALITGGAGKQ